MSDAQGKEYTAVAIPARGQGSAPGAALPCAKQTAPEQPFFEIEYDSCPIPGVGKFVRRAVPIAAPERDEIRERFHRMRTLSATAPLPYPTHNFFSRLLQQRNAAIFYRQAVYMQDFTDDYRQSVPLTQYFPYYQLMGYEQLRTYFTWRTRVRGGSVADTSLSYAFLYLYELLGNIGVTSPQEGLERLLFFWKAFRAFQPGIDKYVLRWLKDYHIYYGLPQSFPDFAAEHELAAHYPELTPPQDRFALYCGLSRYDPRTSVFYTPERAQLLHDCVCFTLNRLERDGLPMEQAVFQPVEKLPVWTPFKNALFYPWYRQPDREVVLSEKERYVCRSNVWRFSAVLTDASGRALLSYLLKQTEAALRKKVGFKRKLTATLPPLSPRTEALLQAENGSLEERISRAVADFYREETKIVVTVDAQSLTRIRRDALLTQDRLLIPEQPDAPPSARPAPAESAPCAPVPVQESTSPWDSLLAALTPVERLALAVLPDGTQPLKAFADAHGVMVEVLADGINEKALDCIGDNLLDDELVLYDDYREPLKKLLEEPS